MPLCRRAFTARRVEQIVQWVEERVYCAVLGPRLCGKTLLLRYIERNLAPLLGWTCVYINLVDLRLTTQRAFFADLIRLTAQRLTALTGKPLPRAGGERGKQRGVPRLPF